MTVLFWVQREDNVEEAIITLVQVQNQSFLKIIENQFILV